jgi:uncharacterized protein YyaL (SSP411 family)
MQRETYADARVREALGRAFLPIRVDGDARPDLAERFRDYHWPATGFLTPDAEPVLALRGHRSPEAFLGILADVRERVRRGGPFPGFTAAVAGTSSGPVDRSRLAGIRDLVRTQFDRRWDPAQAGWGTPQKYPIPEPIEHGLLLARLGRGEEGEARARALRTLEMERRLLDPVWGGMYQYSVGGTWDAPHFEKIVPVNAGALGNFADAFALTRDERWRQAAGAILEWLREFLLAPDGGFYASQDAEPPGGLAGETYFAMDDAGRRRFGVPRVDRNVYAKENGLLVQALARVGTPEAIALATRAAGAVLATHRSDDGLLLHGVRQRAVRYLVDQAEFGRGLVALHQATGERRWLDEAVRIADATGKALHDPNAGGFRDHTHDPAAAGVFAVPLRSLETNAPAARFLLALHVLAEKEDHRAWALSAISAVADPSLVEARGRFAGDLLLAAEEALLPSARVEVVGAADDPATRSLLAEARRIARKRPGIFVLRTDPEATSAALALVCGPGFCSDPVRDAAGLEATISKTLGSR